MFDERDTIKLKVLNAFSLMTCLIIRIYNLLASRAYKDISNDDTNCLNDYIISYMDN